MRKKIVPLKSTTQDIEPCIKFVTLLYLNYRYGAISVLNNQIKILYSTYVFSLQLLTYHCVIFYCNGDNHPCKLCGVFASGCDLFNPLIIIGGADLSLYTK